MAFGLWNVSGRFVIPGTRKHGSFGPVKVAAATRQKASEDLAPSLNEQFRKDLPEGHKFGGHFAMLNLKWDLCSHSFEAPIQKTEGK